MLKWSISPPTASYTAAATLLSSSSSLLFAFLLFFIHMLTCYMVWSHSTVILSFSITHNTYIIDP